MDIEGLGPAVVAQLVENGLIVNVADLYDLHAQDVARLDRMGAKSAENLIRAIEKSKANDLSKLIYGLGIRQVGEKAAKTLAAHFGSMDALVAHVEHFLHLDGEKTLCIGGDLDGCEALAAGMNGAEDVPQLYEALEERGYGKALLEDIFWNNLRRLL